nr:EamA family transporter [Citrobacter freundii]
MLIVPLRHQLLVFAILAAWAFNAVAIKWGVDEMPPLFLTTLRFLIVALAMAPFTRIRREQVPLLCKLAVSFGLMHFSLLFVGMTYSDAGTAAMIVQLGTPFAMIGAILFLKERITLLKATGVLISLVGMAVLTGSPTLRSVEGIVLLLLSALGWAITNLLIKKDNSLSASAMTGWMSLFAFPLTGVMSLLFEEHQLSALQHASWHGWFALIYSALICSVLAYTLWYWLLRRYPVNSIIPVTLLSPVMAILFGVVINGDTLNIYKLCGSVLIVGGAFIATVKPEILRRFRVS